MDLKEVGLNWDEFGKQDPLWSILTDPRYRGNRWDPEKFFETGRRQVKAVMAELDRLGVKVPRGRALDFGCGVGRLTQALCENFDQCSGVDIAPSMLDQAERFNKYGSRCRYVLNQADDLRLFPDNTFDFVFSLIVLQHLEPENAKKYIREFIRILSPGGLVVFQIPSHALAGDAGGHALPASAFRAQISLADHAITIEAGSVEQLSVRVRNTSTECWPGAENPNLFPIHLGNHWLTNKGAPVRMDDGRAQFRNDIQPREEVELTLTVAAPSTAGPYLLELDMVQEGVAWFKDRGSQTCVVPVTVTEASCGRHYVVPVMEMHGVPKPEVLRTIGEAGGKVIQAVEDSAASGWVSYRYFVAKPTTLARNDCEPQEVGAVATRSDPSGTGVESAGGCFQPFPSSTEQTLAQTQDHLVIETLNLHARAIQAALARIIALENKLKEARG